MKYWIIRIPDPMPFGLTLVEAIAGAMVSASFELATEIDRSWH
jgi:hypothetical protein